MPCTINFGDTVIMERCFRPMPFDPGPAFPIFFFDPIFGRTPGRMDLPPEISPDPEPGMMGEMMTMAAMQDEGCKNAFSAAGGVAGFVAGVAITTSLFAAAPIGVAALGVVGAFGAAAAIGGIIGFTNGGFDGGATGAFIGTNTVSLGSVAFRAAFAGRAATAAIAGISQITPQSLVVGGTTILGGIAGAQLGAALCMRLR